MNTVQAIGVVVVVIVAIVFVVIYMDHMLVKRKWMEELPEEENIDDDSIDVDIKLFPGGRMPEKQTAHAAGYDCYVRDTKEEVNPKNGMLQYICYVGFAVSFPDDKVLKLIPRSSIKNTALRLSNSIGVGDSDFTGEYSFVFDVVCGRGHKYKVGERCGQIVLMDKCNIRFNKVEELDETDRGDGGYGHTGLS